MYIYVCVCVRSYIYLYVYTYTYTYICVCTCTHIYTQNTQISTNLTDMPMDDTATPQHCNILQYTAPYSSTNSTDSPMDDTAPISCKEFILAFAYCLGYGEYDGVAEVSHTATLFNTHRNTLQHTITHCNAHCKTLGHT